MLLNQRPWLSLICLVFAALTAVSTGFAQDVITVQNKTYTAGQTENLFANAKVETAGNVIVAASANVKYQSAGSVVLKPGFQVQNGGYFRAYVQPGAQAAPPAEGTTVPATQPLAARYVSMSAPVTLAPGATASVTITLQNTGTTAWTAGSGFNLGSQAPADTTRWGPSRVAFAGTTVSTGQTQAFTFTITAPATAGAYAFQWRLIQNSTWFGDFTPLRTLIVVANPAADSDGDGISNADEIRLGTNPAVPSATDSTNQLQLNLHQPQ